MDLTLTLWLLLMVKAHFWPVLIFPALPNTLCWSFPTGPFHWVQHGYWDSDRQQPGVKSAAQHPSVYWLLSFSLTLTSSLILLICGHIDMIVSDILLCVCKFHWYCKKKNIDVTLQKFTFFANTFFVRVVSSVCLLFFKKTWIGGCVGWLFETLLRFILTDIGRRHFLCVLWKAFLHHSHIRHSESPCCCIFVHKRCFTSQWHLKYMQRIMRNFNKWFLEVLTVFLLWPNPVTVWWCK